MKNKNILVAKNYTVTDHSKWYNNRNSEKNLAENYQHMEQLMVSSASRFVKDLDDVVIHRGTADNIREVFKDHFYVIYDLWKTGVNILYVDLDVLFVKSFEVFGKFEYFSMFNYTSPKKTIDSHYNIKFDNYFNCGVRYYPSTMSHECWHKGLELMASWNPNRWDSEQIIYNHMMWSQNVSISDVHRPELAYQYINNTIPANNRFNDISINDACAIHFHGTRDSESRLQTMKETSDAVENT